MPAGYSQQLLWTNNAQTTLAGSITNVGTTANLASGSGVLFGSPSAGQGFTGTFTDAATGLLHEIVLVTGRSGDTITMIRAQEGTTGLSWLANDLFANLWTAGAAETLIQLYQLQQQPTNYAVDTGSINSYIAAFTPAIGSAPAAGTPLRVKIGSGNTNTGPSVINAGWGSVSIVRRDGSALIGGELVALNNSDFEWNGTSMQWMGAGPATAAAISAGTDVQSFVNPSQLATSIIKPPGQCYLQFTSATVITLIPYAGNIVPVAGLPVALPGAGVTGSNTSVTINGTPSSNLAASTVYLVALGATGALEYWTLATGHNPDTTAGNIGVEVITGHVTKTLVGMVATNGSSQFVNSNASHQVLSWFNRQLLKSKSYFTSDVTVSSGTVAELDASIRNTFLVWSNQQIPFSVTGYIGIGGSGGSFACGISFDGNTPEIEGAVGSCPTASGGDAGPNNFNGVKQGLSEGKHYATLFGNIINQACVWIGGSVKTPDIVAQGPCNQLVIDVLG